MNLLKYISLFLFIVPFSAKSQNYIPFPDSNATWSVINCFKGDSPPFDFCNGPIDRYEFRLVGDTVVSGNTYKKLYDYYNSPHNSIKYVGAIREDSLKRIFFHGNIQRTVFNLVTLADTAKEYLLYHFGLNVGDTVSVKANSSDSPRFILSIDSVLINGEFRLRYEVSNPYLLSIDYWIEGIGSESGLFGPYSAEFENKLFLCEFQQNGVSIWPDSGSRCLTVSVEETGLSREINVYPNPTQNILYFKTSSSYQIKNVTVIDLSGRNILQIQQSSINTSEFPQGVYFYQVELKNGALVRGKFVKE